MGPCVLSISPWSADIGSVGSALGHAQALLIWNLSLHAWTWSVLVDILRHIGELVVIPKPSKPHKAFLSVLVHCRHHVVLPHKLFQSFGMRKFIVLITDNRLPFPVFRRDLEKYIYQSKRPQDDYSHSVLPPTQAPLKINRDHKGKEVVGLHTDGFGTSVISARDQPR